MLYNDELFITCYAQDHYHSKKRRRKTKKLLPLKAKKPTKMVIRNKGPYVTYSVHAENNN